ncbi:MAG: glycosyltransferase [Bacteroidales bacterium]
MQGKDIVITGIQPWDIEIGSNCKNIALEFSKKNRVLYINAPLDRNTLKSKKNDVSILKRLKMLRGEISCYEMVNENLTVFYPNVILESIQKVPLLSLFRWLNKINNKRFAAEIKKAINENDFHDFLHFNDSDMFRSFFMKELLKPVTSIYYIRDNLVKNPYWKKYGQFLEPELIAKSDVVVTNSLYYADYANKFTKNAYMVGQGCDISIYDEDKNHIEIATELKLLKNPIIGYIGFLTSRRLDINLVRLIAQKRPDWTIVLVGPEDANFISSDLHQFENIVFLGSKPAEELPSYTKGFDVCINPQILNDATIGNYPRKIDEYLAMGKPTVATWTKAMEYFTDHVYLAKSPEDYIVLIDKALKENNEDKYNSRKKIAAEHTWENNVDAIYNAILKINQ